MLTRSQKLNIALKSDDALVSFTKPHLVSDRQDKVAIITRVSSLKQANEKNIDVQLQQCQQIFKQHFLDQPSVLVHTSINEALNLETKDLNFDFFDVLNRIELGEINTIITVSYDRIFRGANRVLNAEISQIFTNNKVKLITADGVKIYEPTNIYGSLIDSVQESLGVVEKKNLVRKLQTARRHHLTERRQWKHSICPFAYKISTLNVNGRKEFLYEVVEEEAEIVRDIYRIYTNQAPKFIPPMTEQYPGVMSIAKHLNNCDIPKQSWLDRVPAGHQAKSKSTKWNSVFVNRVLTNPIYKGELIICFNETAASSAYRGEAIAQKISVPPVVSKELWNDVEKVRANKSTIVKDKFNQSAQKLNWLHKKIKCSNHECNHTLSGFTSSKGTRYYTCKSKRKNAVAHRTFSAHDIEKAIAKLLLSRLKDGVIWPSMMGISVPIDQADHSKQIEAQKKKLTDLEAQKTKLTDLVVKGLLDDQEFVSQRARILQEIELTNQQLASIKTLSQQLNVRDFSLKKDVLELEERFNSIISTGNPDLFSILKIASNTLIGYIHIKPIQLPDLSTLSIDELKDLYNQHIIMPKNLRSIGWSDRKIAAMFGPCGRSKAKDYHIEVVWATGRSELL